MIYDISMEISPDMTVWPGDPNIEFTSVCSIKDGDSCNVTRVSISVHTGTHADAPSHFIAGGKSIHELSLDTFVGKCTLLDVSGVQVVSAATLASRMPLDCRRLLLRTDNSSTTTPGGAFRTDFVALDASAARLLVERQVQLVGIDYFSIEPFYAEQGNPVHTILLANEIVILEGLNLVDVPEGTYELLAAPIHIRGVDGAPCRALLRTV